MPSRFEIPRRTIGNAMTRFAAIAVGGAALMVVGCAEKKIHSISDETFNRQWRDSSKATLSVASVEGVDSYSNRGTQPEKLANSLKSPDPASPLSSNSNANDNPSALDDAESARLPAGSLRCNMVFSKDVSRLKPNGRLMMDLQDLQDRMSEKGTEKIVKSLSSSFVRMKLLHLQALSKVYLRRDLKGRETKRLEAFRQDIKTVEKIIGDYMRIRDLEDLVETVPFVKPEVLAHLQLRKKAAKVQIEDDLAKLGWAPDPFLKLNQLMIDVAELQLGSGAEDQELTVQGLRDLVQQEREVLKDLGPHFKPARYSQEDLENGLHTMRRALRWVAMIFPATEGMFAARGEAGMQSANLESYGDSKYFQTSRPPGVEQVRIDRATLLKIVMLIEKLGELKDFKESELDYAEFLLHDGFAKSMDEAMGASHQVMVQAFKGDRDIENEARQLYRFYLKEDPLKELRKQLDRRLDKY